MNTCQQCKSTDYYDPAVKDRSSKVYNHNTLSKMKHPSNCLICRWYITEVDRNRYYSSGGIG